MQKQNELTYYSRMDKHILIEELNTPKYQAYYLSRPDYGRLESTLIIFSPEGTTIIGDLAPSYNGCSTFNPVYAREWFIRDLSPDYLAEKFLQEEYRPELARQIVEMYLTDKGYYGFTKDVEDELRYLLKYSDCFEDPTSFYNELNNIHTSLTDDLDVMGYNPKDVDLLGSIHRRFRELYLEMKQQKDSKSNEIHESILDL